MSTAIGQNTTDLEALLEQANNLPDGGVKDPSVYATEDWVDEHYQPKGDYLQTSTLQDAVNNALEQAKESGEFNGDSGVYTLVEGETAEDAPEWATVVVDPYTEPAAVEMIATLDDGTSVTYKLYGGAVTA